MNILQNYLMRGYPDKRNVWTSESQRKLWNINEEVCHSYFVHFALGTNENFGVRITDLSE